VSTVGGTQLIAGCELDLEAEWEHLRACLPGQPGLARPLLPEAGCDVLAWARSGLMDLTGCPDGPPLAPASPVLGRAELLAAMIGELSAAAGARVTLAVPHVLAGRARLRGWQRRGRTSANGSCRLLRAADGWLAVNLARPDDVAAVPAVIGAPAVGAPAAGEPGDGGAWAALSRHAAARPAIAVAAAAQAVGIPAAVLGGDGPEPVRVIRAEPARGGADTAPSSPDGAPRFVLDLSAMWAGPLCARILRDAGWRVLKAEDSRRPDGARFGPPQFYAELHSGIPAVRLDFGTAAGRAELARLAGQAAVVIESSRPRALRRLGLHADEWLAARPGRIWVSITGYGRDDPQQRVAFGDDAAVAGGLVAAATDGSPAFCADAIADPLTGMLAAAAALAAARIEAGPVQPGTVQAGTIQRGTGPASAADSWLLDIAMAGVCAELARPSLAAPAPHRLSRDEAGWTAWHGHCSASVRAWS
jgi:crotonobetainyl-CoA:carnitine CoA-transferase CaiB-like acyl-CoA transferase